MEAFLIEWIVLFLLPLGFTYYSILRNMFHKEGFKIIINTFLLCAAISILSEYCIDPFWLQKAVQLLSVIILVLVLQFFRNPKRNTLPNQSHIISPVDGKVVVIEEVFEKEYFKDKRLQVSIFMSPLNVHVTRYAISGLVVFSKYHPGKYLVAWHPKSSELNERTTVVVENKTLGQILYRQVAGAVARRIVNYAKVGDEVIQGTDAGFIKFGSRVDLFLPLGTKIKVEKNEVVKGGQDCIGEV
jgi:phosphatidylserine decarboxylase